jgi:DNA processing protein
MAEDGKAGRRLTDAQRLAWLRLIRSENVGPTTFRMLINRFGGAEEALAALPRLSARGGLKRQIRIAEMGEAEAELGEAARLGVRVIAMGEPDYPQPLLHTEGAPPLLFVRGEAAILARPMVAIVGSRNCSAAGRRIAGSIAAGLGEAGFAIVSGLARGIDAGAHRGALKTGTVAVLAGGVDKVYPQEHDELYAAIMETGAILSEMPLGLEPRGRDFPRRNRIIAGLALGTVIVEAASRSGSLITARLANETGREVFAVPGSPLDPRAHGTNRLIRDGAAMARSADDVIEVLAPLLEDPERAYGAAPLARPPTEPEGAEAEAREWTETLAETDRDRVVEALGAAPIDIDEIIRHTQLAPGAVHTVLLELELAGRLARHGGQLVSIL